MEPSKGSVNAAGEPDDGQQQQQHEPSAQRWSVLLLATAVNIGINFCYQAEFVLGEAVGMCGAGRTRAAGRGEKAHSIPCHAFRWPNPFRGPLRAGTPLYRSLGMNHNEVSLAWLSGPIPGLVLQPIVGVLSDATTTRWGKRKPWIAAGAALTVRMRFAVR